MTWLHLRFVHFLALIAFIVPALAVAQETPREQRIMNMGTIAFPAHWNPVYVTTVYGAQVGLFTFAQLVDHGEGGQFKPDLAESWTISDDGLTYTFTIRPDAKWSDGTPITAQSIAESFEWLSQQEDAPFSAQLRETEFTAYISEERTQILEFRLKAPRAIFLSELADERSSPLPVHRADLMADSAQWSASDTLNMVYSGPYMITAADEAQLSLRPNPHYFDQGRLRNSGVNLRVYSEKDQAAYGDFMAGTLDLMVMRIAGQQEFLTTTMAEYLVRVDVPSITYLHLNTGRAPLDNPSIRKALYLASLPMRQTSFYDDNWLVPISAFLPLRTQSDFIPQGFSTIDDISFAQALDRSRALLSEAGYHRANPLRIELAINQSDLNRRLANLLRAHWSQAFIQLEIVERPVRDHYATLRRHDFSIGRAGFRSPINHPSTMFGTLSTTSQFNHADYNNPEYDELLRQLQAETDPDRLKQLTREAHQLLMTDHPVIPLYQTQEVILRHPGVRWGQTGFSGFIDLTELHDETIN